MTDRQRDRVYSWEGDWAAWNSCTMKLSKAREYVRWACRCYGLKPPGVKQHKGKAFSFSCGNVISFSHDQINPGTALHEAAHYICDQIFGEDLQHHCPEWMGIYLWLLEEARIAPSTALRASAKARGIRWLKTWLVSPKRLRRAVRGSRIARPGRPPSR